MLDSELMMHPEPVNKASATKGKCESCTIVKQLPAQQCLTFWLSRNSIIEGFLIIRKAIKLSET